MGLPLCLSKGLKMVTFRCKRSGCLVTFNTDYDIAQMRKHPEYEEVKEPSTQKTKG
jgi:hypothetical protein